MRYPILGTILLGVVRNLEGNAYAGGRNQQAKGETMTFLVDNLLLVVTPALGGVAAAITGAVRVLRFLSGLADQRRVDQEQESSPLGFLRQQCLSQRRIEIRLLPSRPC